MPGKSVLPSILIAAYIFLSSGRTAAQNIYIPAFDPVNSQIEELIARGYLRGLNVTERPWLRSEIIGLIREDETRFGDRDRKLAAKILEELQPPQKKRGMSAGFIAGMDLRGLSRENRHGYFIQRGRYFDRGFKSELGAAFNGGWWISRDSSWGVDTRMIYDTDGTNYPWYFGRPREARTVVQFDHAYAALKLGNLDISLGRQRMAWGPSPRGSLLLDRGSPPLDMAGARFRFSPFTLSWFSARLGDYYDPVDMVNNRQFLSGHRLTLNTGKGWEIGLSEIVLYGGPDRIFEIYYSIPVVLYYWEGFNHDIDDNVLWGLDFSYTSEGIGRSYLQFVADDIQYKNNGPQKFALQAGSYLVPSKFPGWSGLVEFNMVDTYVYGQRKRRNAYLNWNRPLSRLDSDQYEFFVGIYRELARDLKAGAEYILRAKGEFDARDNLPIPTPLDTKFPSGIVENLNDIRLTAAFNAENTVDISFSAGYQKIGNFRNIENSSLEQFYSTIDISYYFNTGLPFWTKYR